MKAATGRALGRAVLALSLCLTVTHGAAALDEAQARGKQIYLKGTSPSGGEINAIVGAEAVRLPASAAPCGSCHGPDGLGRPEGGLLPPDIRWSQLTKVYGHVHEDGRKHGPFDEASLAALMRSGDDPDGNRLDKSMPLYEMSDQDMADLVAYLVYLEHDLDPGVDADRVQVGSLLPLQGPRGAVGQAMAQVMHAHFQEINAAGGVYGRRIELLAVPYGASHDATMSNLRAAFRSEGIFAMVGAYTVGMDEPVLELLRTEGAPLVGPFTLDPGDEMIDALAFYMYPGFDEQARALADHALAEGAAKEAPLVLVGPEGGRVDRLVASVQEQVNGKTAAKSVVLRYAPGKLDGPGVASKVKESGSEAVFFFGRQAELDHLLASLANNGKVPRVYLLSSFVSRPPFEAPPGFHHRIFVGFPTHLSDVSDKGRNAYLELARRHALPRGHMQAQIAALAAAKLMEEGLRRAGRDLSRVRLVEGLEALYAFQTELTPPLTYGPNRRIGAQGAHVMAVDLMKKAYQPAGDGWREAR